MQLFNHRFLSIFFSLILGSFLYSNAQNFPVDATVQVFAPYSPYLTDYTAPEKRHIALRIANKDDDELKIRLRLRIEGKGATLITKPSLNPLPLFLPGNGELNLTGDDLDEYFNVDNLDADGLDIAQLRRTKRLDEGIYTFNVEVLDYDRKVPLSASTQRFPTNIASIFLSNPPMWVIPQQNEVIRASFPQVVRFQWLPMNTGSPNSSFSTEYDFKMVELWPEGRDPNDAIRTQTPIYEGTITDQVNSLTNMDVSSRGLLPMPLLTPGRRYAVQLRARAQGTTGADIDLFRNEGKSEVLVFTFGEACLVPFGLRTEILNANQARVSWNGQPGNTEFTLQYREQNQDEWYEIKSILNTNYQLNKLNGGKIYEFRIQGICGSVWSETTDATTFSLPIVEEGAFVCNPNATTPATPVGEPKLDLKIGDEIKAMDHTFLITEVASVGEGIYTGKGIITIPFLNKAQLHADFTTMRVNTAMQATGGKISLTGGTIDPIPEKIKNTLKQVTGTATDWANKGIGFTDQATDVIHQVDAKIDDINKTLDAVKNLPAEAKTKLEEGKKLYEEGKKLVAAGNTDLGMEKLNEAATKIKEGTKTAVDALKNGSAGQVAGNVLNQADKLKEIFEKVLKEKKDTLERDSVENTLVLEKTKNEYERLKKELEGAVYIENEEDFESNESNEDTDKTFITLDQNEISSELMTEEVNTLKIASENKYQNVFQKVLIEKSLGWIEKYKIENELNFNELISTFKTQAADLLKTIALNALQGKEQEKMEIQVKNFVSSTLNDAITK